MNKLSKLDIISLVLLIIGGLNWGMVGIFNIDLVSSILGEMSTLSVIVYILVALSAIKVLLGLGKYKKD